MADIIDLMLATGARIGEVLALVERHRPRGATRRDQCNDQDRARQRDLPQAPDPSADRRAAGSRDHRVSRSPGHAASRRPPGRRVPDAQRDLAAGQQRRTALAADPQGGRPGVGDPECVPRPPSLTALLTPLGWDRRPRVGRSGQGGGLPRRCQDARAASRQVRVGEG